MREEQRVAFRRFDAPQIVKLDHEPVGLEQRRAHHLAFVMEAEGDRGKSSTPPGGMSLSQVIAPFSTLRSQISGSRRPQVMASTNGGQRLTVSSSRMLIALKVRV